jgi:aspartokinase
LGPFKTSPALAKFAEEEVSLVAVVGRRFSKQEVAAALNKAGIVPKTVLESPSGKATCVLVKQSESDSAVRALHRLLKPPRNPAI